MANTIQTHDFIEVDYTGKLVDGAVFDTTVADVARKNNIFNPKLNYSPVTICLGEKQILPGLDQHLLGKEVGKSFVVTLEAEEAFGKRDVKRVKIVPLTTFKDHKVQPFPGLQIDVDGEMGTITSISGGRVIVNFNHPLAGKQVVYEVKPLRTITSVEEKIKAYVHTTLRLPVEKLKVVTEAETTRVEMPFAMPEQLFTMLAAKLELVTGAKGVRFQVVSGQKE